MSTAVKYAWNFIDKSEFQFRYLRYVRGVTVDFSQTFRWNEHVVNFFAELDPFGVLMESGMELNYDIEYSAKIGPHCS